MTRTRHLSAEELLGLLAGDAAGPAPRAADHLRDCDLCRLEREHFLALRDRPRAAVETPSDLALARAYGQVQSRPPRRSERAGYVRPLVVYDSRGEERAVAGIRAPAGGRHLAWRSELADVEVQWTDEGPEGAGVLTGQVLPRRPAAAGAVGDAWLEQSGEPARWSLLGPSGEFTLPVPRGRKWGILLRWGAIRMRLSP